MVQIVPKYQGALALCNSTTYSPITKVHFVQYSSTIVQLCSKGTLGPWVAQLVHLAQYNSTTWFPITKWTERTEPSSPLDLPDCHTLV